MQAMGIEAGAQQAPPNPLAVLTGTSGTRSDIALRVVQFVSAIFGVVAMVSADDFSTVSAFRFLVAASSLQMAWSFLLAVWDVFVMVGLCPQHHWLASQIIFGDTITGTLTFCSAFASAGMVTYLHFDIETCGKEHCTQFQNAMARCLISFAAIGPSLIANFIIY